MSPKEKVAAIFLIIGFSRGMLLPLHFSPLFLAASRALPARENERWKKEGAPFLHPIQSGLPAEWGGSLPVLQDRDPLRNMKASLSPFRRSAHLQALRDQTMASDSMEDVELPPLQVSRQVSLPYVQTAHALQMSRQGGAGQQQQPQAIELVTSVDRKEQAVSRAKARNIMKAVQMLEYLKHLSTARALPESPVKNVRFGFF